MDRKINVISHRGANVYAPQNTLPAFKKAVEIGADGFETDVHITRDGVPVLCHNYTIEETSNGHGKISNMTLSELKQKDFGFAFSPKYKDTRIPTVEEFLSFVETTGISILNIELKSPKESETNIVSDTIDLVKAHGLFEKLIISSFNPALLLKAKEIDERTKTGLLYSPEKVWTYKNRLVTKPTVFAKEIGADALHPMYNYLNEKYVYTAHENGLQVNVWTVNSVRMIETMIGYGVDGIITNFPDVARGLVEKHTY